MPVARQHYPLAARQVAYIFQSASQAFTIVQVRWRRARRQHDAPRRQRSSRRERGECQPVIFATPGIESAQRGAILIFSLLRAAEAHRRSVFARATAIERHMACRPFHRPHGAHRRRGAAWHALHHTSARYFAMREDDFTGELI